MVKTEKREFSKLYNIQNPRNFTFSTSSPPYFFFFVSRNNIFFILILSGKLPKLLIFYWICKICCGCTTNNSVFVRRWLATNLLQLVVRLNLNINHKHNFFYFLYNETSFSLIVPSFPTSLIGFLIHLIYLFSWFPHLASDF